MVPEISNATDRFFVILGHFLPFYPSNSPKNENSKKWKKKYGYIIILRNCTNNYDYRLYCSWDMTWRMQLLVLILANSPKNEIFKKMKKMSGDIIILHKWTKNSWSYAILYLRYGVWRI